MYLVTIDNGAGEIPVHSQQYKLHSGTVVQGINTIDSFTFTALPGNPAFGALNDFTTLVRVYNTTKKRYEFEGRVLCSTVSMAESGLLTQEATCESVLGYLCDSVQDYVPEQTWTARDLLSHILSNHNSQVETYKKINRGAWEVPDGTWTGVIERGNSLETLKKVLDIFGGEMQVYRDTLLYLRYKPKFGGTSDTPIALSKNMKAITRERDPSSFITRLIPLGAKKGDDTEERITITDYNGGKNYIDDAEALAKYGIHVGYVEFDDATDAPTLLSKGRAWLTDNNKVLVKYAITALDLSRIGLAIDDFEVHNYYPIKHKLLGVDDVARVIKKTIDITDETKTTIEIGESFKTLSEMQRERYDSLGTEVSGVLKTVQTSEARILQAISDTYVTGDQLQSAISGIEITKDKIVAAVGETFATKDELDGYVTTNAMESRINATVNGLNLSAYAKTTDLKAYAKEADINQFYLNHNQRIEYIRTEMQSQLDLKADSATLSTYGETLDAYGNRLDSAEAKIATSVQVGADGKITSAVNIDADKFTLQSNGFSIKNNAIYTSNKDNKPLWEDPGYTEITGGKIKNYDLWPEENINISHQIVELTAGKLWFTRSWIPDTGILTDSDRVQKSASLGWWADAQGLEQAGVNASYQIPLRLAAERLALGYETSTIGTMYGKAWTIMPTDQVLVRPGQLFYVSSPDVSISSGDKVTIGGSSVSLPTVSVYGKEITIGAENNGDYGDVNLMGFIYVNGIPLDEYILMYTASNK